MFSGPFLKAAFERAAKTFFQAILALLAVDGLDWLSVNWGDVFLTAGIAAALSFVSSMATASLTDGSPSATDAEKLVVPLPEPRL